MKRSMKTIAILLAFSAAIPFAIPSAVARAATLNGAGSTAIYPLVSAWAQEYKRKTGVAVNYQAIGSGGGIKQIEVKTVDFAASDKPLRRQELARHRLVQFPQAIISIVPVVNLPGVAPGSLVLDGPTLAAIFLGKIRKWNDPAIRKLNPKLRLPNRAIIVVHRSDGSGTTFNFTNYLSKVSPLWRQKVGSDSSVAWPSGISGKGNAGVAVSVTKMVGAIGYVEYAYARQKGLVYTDMVNAAGMRVRPSIKTFQAAVRSADFTRVQDFYLILTNQPGKDSWPIVAATYVLMRSDYAPGRNRPVLKFLNWALQDGRLAAARLDYVPLPPETVKQIRVSWSKTLKLQP